MKKLLFTIQMIALVAMFPVYLVTELNQEKGNIPVNNPPSELIKKTGKTNVQPELNPTYNGLSFSMLKPNN